MLKIPFDDLYLQILALQTEGLVTIRPHPSYPSLQVVNYTDKCTFEKAWSPITLSCRGLVLCTSLQKIVAVGLPKFFNLGELPGGLENLPKEDYVIQDKLDGSNIISFYYEPSAAWLCCTRGSFESDQARLAADLLKEIQQSVYLDRSVCYNFELIHPSNRVVLNYGDTKSLVLLDSFDVNTLKSTKSPLKGMHPYLSYPCRYLGPEDLEGLPTFVEQLRNKEGVVLKYDSGYRVKLKTSEYCSLHKAKFGLTPLAVWEAMTKGTEATAQFIREVPEEFRKDAERYRDILKEKVDKIYLYAVTWLLTDNKNLLSRKDLAAELKLSSFPYPATVWALYDGRKEEDIMGGILKGIRPHGNVL